MTRLVAILLLLPAVALGFVAQNNGVVKQYFPLQALPSEDEFQTRQHTKNVMTTTLLPLAMAGLLALAPPAWAEEAASPPTPAAMSIEACKKDPSGTTNCVSTRNVKQLDLYAPPWTFESSPEEAAARIKGVIASDPNLELTAEQDGLFFQIKATRSIFSDTLQLKINPQDKVVIFRAEQEGESSALGPSVSDFGALRKELDSIRQKCKFGVMGQGYAADTMPSQNGPLGQLKAFYGLQSGQGFEQVFEEN